MASAVKQIATAADKTSQARADAKEAKTENADEATTVESESEGGDSDGEEDDFLFNRQDLQQAIAAFSLSDNNQDMDYRGCEEALDGLFGIYKVSINLLDCILVVSHSLGQLVRNVFFVIYT